MITDLPSIREVRCSLVSEVENSLNYDFLEYRERRRKPMSLSLLKEALIYYFSFIIYEKEKSFKAGIYKSDFEKPEYKDGDILTGSGIFYSAEDTGIDVFIDETLKISNQRIEVKTLYQVKFSEIFYEHSPQPLQQMIDIAKSKIDLEDPDTQKAEKEGKKYLDSLIKNNLNRALIRWGESRGQTAREFVHSSFRNKIQEVIKKMIQSEDLIQESNGCYSKTRSLNQIFQEGENRFSFNQSQNRVFEELLSIVHEFEQDMIGVSNQEQIELQIRRDQGENVNAPQIFRSDKLEEIFKKLFDYKIENDSIGLSDNNIYEIFQVAIERYTGTSQLTNHISSDTEGRQIDNSEFHKFLQEDNSPEFIETFIDDGKKSELLSGFEQLENRIEIVAYYCLLEAHELAEIEPCKFYDQNDENNFCSIDTLDERKSKELMNFISKVFGISLDKEKIQSIQTSLETSLLGVAGEPTLEEEKEAFIEEMKLIILDEYFSKHIKAEE